MVTMRRMQLAVLLALVLAVVASGFAWPLGLGSYSIWPFSRAWHMFGRNDGNHYQLVVTGELEDGRPAAISMDRWFAYEVTPFSRRYNEIYRDPASVHALAAFVCRRYNADASAGARLLRVSIADHTWPIEAGSRRPYTDVPRSTVRTWPYLDRAPCASL
jgi:hypothetical protein